MLSTHEKENAIYEWYRCLALGNISGSISFV